LIYRQKPRSNLVVDDKNAEKVVEIICDCWIFIIPVEEIIRIRTFEKGRDAI